MWQIINIFIHIHLIYQSAKSTNDNEGHFFAAQILVSFCADQCLVMDSAVGGLIITFLEEFLEVTCSSTITIFRLHRFASRESAEHEDHEVYSLTGGGNSPPDDEDRRSITPTCSSARDQELRLSSPPATQPRPLGWKGMPSLGHDNSSTSVDETAQHTLAAVADEQQSGLQQATPPGQRFAAPISPTQPFVQEGNESPSLAPRRACLETSPMSAITPTEPFEFDEAKQPDQCARQTLDGRADDTETIISGKKTGLLLPRVAAPARHACPAIHPPAAPRPVQALSGIQLAD